MKVRGLLLLLPALVCAATALGDDWPQWRGPRRDDVSKETGLLQQWPKAGPKLLWLKKDAGIGFSGPGVVGTTLYTMGAKDGSEFLYALDVEKGGKELWNVKIGPTWTNKDNRWGDGPRSTPTIDGDRIYALGGQGILICSTKAGKEIWRKDLVKDFGGKVMEYNEGQNWGFCESVLVDQEKAVCCPGGPKGLMIAFDKMSGKDLWRSSELKCEASDASIVVAEFGGVRQYVQTYYEGNESKKGGCVGIAAKDGKLLWNWSTDRYNVYAIAPTPIIQGDFVYLTAGYKAGCNLLKISQDAKGKFKADEQYDDDTQNKTMVNDHGGVVLVGKHVYGYSDTVGWLCQDFATGKPAWSEKRKLAGKSGSLTYADGCLYLLDEGGVAVLLKATAAKWTELGRFSLPEEAPSREDLPNSRAAKVWTHPVVANGRLYLRDQELLFCYDVRAGK